MKFSKLGVRPGGSRRSSWTGHIFDMEAVSGGDAYAPCEFATGCGPDVRAGTLQDYGAGKRGQDWDVFVAWQKWFPGCEWGHWTRLACWMITVVDCKKDTQTLQQINHFKRDHEKRKNDTSKNWGFSHRIRSSGSSFLSPFRTARESSSSSKNNASALMAWSPFPISPLCFTALFKCWHLVSRGRPPQLV